MSNTPNAKKYGFGMVYNKHGLKKNFGHRYGGITYDFI